MATAQEPTEGLAPGPTGDARGSALYDNVTMALDTLERAVVAHGGKEWIEGKTALQFRIEGRYYLQGHLERPWAHHEFQVEGEFLHVPADDALRTRVHLQRDRGMTTYCALNGPQGIQQPQGRPVAGQLDEAEVARLWREELEWTPGEFLRQASASRASVTSLGSTSSHNIVQYQMVGGPRRALYFGADDHLLWRVEEIVHLPAKGDRLRWREFRDYEATESGARVPSTIEIHEEHATTQSDWRVTLHDIVVGCAYDESDLVLPGPYRGVFPDLHVARFPHAKDEAPLPISTLGSGVHAIGLEAENGRSLLIEFADHCLMWESGGSSDSGEALLDAAQRIAPHKPVRYLAMSHHHRLSASGLRPFVQRGITLLALPGNEAYLRDLASRPYLLAPDALGQAPREPRFRWLTGPTTFQDEGQRVELYPFDSSRHTDEYVFTYLPELKLGAVGDLLYLPPGASTAAAARSGVRAEALFDFIREMGLPVDFITQAFPIDPRYERISVR